MKGLHPGGKMHRAERMRKLNGEARKKIGFELFPFRAVVANLLAARADGN
jgi:hypothetical protein